MDKSENRRCVLLAEHMISTKATVRSTAAAFGISKSTVHKDLTERLKNTSPELFKQVRAILEENKRERHIRGGLATKHKYESRHKLLMQRS
ncbi:MAG: sporulation transcriptional regulator SpoIIID [Ruminococcus sp.]|nr:sporulation transcriptional regulator SpoIIID [Ruminococcus sp.]